MKCPHGVPEGGPCRDCGGVARSCPGCTRSGRCWRHPMPTVVVTPYTFRPFEPIDSTIHPFVVSPAGEDLTPAPAGILPGLSWAPPPAVTLSRAEPGALATSLDCPRWLA